jgi:ketosteroid isomerase-like protein
MAHENVDVVKRAIAAVNERDVEAYLACCTDDFQLRTPVAPIQGVYEGRDAIRRFFADVQDTVANFRLDLEQVTEIAPDRVLAFLRMRGSGRASGIRATPNLPGEATNVYDLVDGKIRRVQVFLNRQEALDAMGHPA